MADCMVFHTQIASIMKVLANAAVEEICKLVDDDYAVFRLEITQNQKENRVLRRKHLELKVARERVLASIVKILDHYRGMARGEGHLTGGHRSFVKPAEHNTWRDDQPITVDEGSGTSTQHIIVIEYAYAEAAGPGVKQKRSEGEEDPRHSRDIQTGEDGLPPLETDTKTVTVTQRYLLTDWGCPAPSSEYLLYNSTSLRKVHSHRDFGDETGNDLSCSYTTEMDPGMPLGLETQTDPSRGDLNRYSSSVYSEGCLDKKGEGLIVDDVTVKVEGDMECA
ncbi:uncharacterized protein LOC118936895 [Oncorhynchus mykiss]|uniref:uncharacterized protein LOC118936895 n=1 Tax=Oncorhynchus mykiss TaxID=8022 RepID=UPI0018779AC2|nr:uncharacterized protein LOC118936895 [Oncorhynchus mykiss]